MEKNEDSWTVARGMVMKPEFPLKVIFNDGDEWILNNVEEVEGSLEWFDSDEPQEEATLLDKLNRPVRPDLKIGDLQFLIFELIEQKSRERNSPDLKISLPRSLGGLKAEVHWKWTENRQSSLRRLKL